MSVRVLTVGNMYPPHSLGGYELMWQTWVGHATSRGHAVRVLTTDFELPQGAIDDDDGGVDVHRELRWYWRDHRFLRLGPRGRLRIERHNAEVFERHLRQLDPDAVVWWAMAGMSVSPIERARRAGVPGVAVLADYWLEYAPRVDAWARPFLRRPRLARAVERLTGEITRVDLATGVRCVFSSDLLRRGAVAAWPNLGPSEVVPPEPHDVSRFRFSEPQPWRWNLLYVGRIDQVKGVDLAVLALAELPDEATLTILGAGNDDYLAKLRKLVRRRGLEDRVSFDRRPRNELPEIYANADAVLFPVRWAEPFGLVPLEAMAAGTPVIATGRGGSGEYLDDGSNCLIFDPRHGAQELADRIRRLAADGPLRERLREGGRRTIESVRAARFNERVLANVGLACEAPSWQRDAA